MNISESILALIVHCKNQILGDVSLGKEITNYFYEYVVVDGQLCLYSKHTEWWGVCHVTPLVVSLLQ